MPKTKREMLFKLADKIGGKGGDRLRSALKKKSVIDDLLDRPMTDDEFAVQLEQLEGDLPKVLENMKGAGWGKPGTWGLPN